MNKYEIIGLIVLLAVILIFLLKTFVPSVRKIMERMPGWVTFLLIAIVIVAIILLVSSLIKTGGLLGTEGETTAPEKEEQQMPVNEAEIENCIIVRADEVLIGGDPVDINFVDSYLNTKANEAVTVTLVDDFALASLYRTVRDMCEEKGVRYDTQDETWLEKQ